MAPANGGTLVRVIALKSYYFELEASMSHVLVTGGTGVLGRALVPLLQNTGQTVRVVSRRAPTKPYAHIEWAQADLQTGAGLREAVSGIHTIVHTASSPFKQTYTIDVEGTQRLLDAARNAGVQHVVYISIVGIEKIPYDYYQHKVAAENLVMNAGLPWTIARATQFHELLDGMLQAATRLPVTCLPTDFYFQPVDAREVAMHLCAVVETGPCKRLPDIGGPEVFRLRELARTWLEVRRRFCWVLPLPSFGKVAHAFRNAYNTNPLQRQGEITWAQWVRRKYRNSSESHPTLTALKPSTL
jgi:uncharacterized protein YbjT (DUF2867 family)